MSSNPNRREFLAAVSLAGAALVVGGGAGCGAPPKMHVDVDDGGCILVEDPALGAKLYEQWKRQHGKPDSGSRKGLCVVFTDPAGNKVNSLCTC